MRVEHATLAILADGCELAAVASEGDVEHGTTATVESERFGSRDHVVQHHAAARAGSCQPPIRTERDHLVRLPGARERLLNRASHCVRHLVEAINAGAGSGAAIRTNRDTYDLVVVLDPRETVQ